MSVTLQVAELRPRPKYHHGAADPVCAPRGRATSARPRIPKKSLVAGESGVLAFTTAPPALSDKAQSEKSHRQTLNDLCDRIINMVVTSFAAKDGEAWVEYWVSRIPEYEEQSAAFRKLVNLVGRDEGAYAASCIEVDQAIVARFPEAAGEYSFLEYTVKRSVKRVADFDANPVSEEKRAADADAAQRFNYFGSCYGMCTTALAVIADPAAYGVATEFKPSDDIIESIWMVARMAALEMNDASLDGHTYRRATPLPVEDAPATDTAFDIPDDLAATEEAIRRFEGPLS